MKRLAFSLIFLTILTFGTIKTTTISPDGAPRPGCLPGDSGPCPPSK